MSEIPQDLHLHRPRERRGPLFLVLTDAREPRWQCVGNAASRSARIRAVKDGLEGFRSAPSRRVDPCPLSDKPPRAAQTHVHFRTSSLAPRGPMSTFRTSPLAPRRPMSTFGQAPFAPRRPMSTFGHAPSRRADACPLSDMLPRAGRPLLDFLRDGPQPNIAPQTAHRPRCVDLEGFSRGFSRSDRFRVF